VKIGYAKKVWWLCREGHEWQATIKCRMKRNDCHICEKEEAKKKADVSISIPTIGQNYRNNRRFKTNSTALIEVRNSGHWLYADMTDFSSHGLSFETEAAIQPGTLIRIQLDKALLSSRLDKPLKSSFNGGYKTYNSTVQWCKKIDDDQSGSIFGIGVKLF